MKFIATAACFFWLIYCEAAPTEQEAERIRITIQHFGVGSLLAHYYCEAHQWPRSFDELQRYQAERKVGLPMSIDWEALKDPALTLIVGEQVVLITPGTPKAALARAVKSTHSHPDCDESQVHFKFLLDLGTGTESMEITGQIDRVKQNF